MKRNIFLFGALFFLLSSSRFCQASTMNRVFTTLERPDKYVIHDRSRLDATFFYLNASTAHRRGGGSGGIPELWGKYDLQDVIGSLRAVRPTANPVRDITGNDDLLDKSIKFKMQGTVHACGTALNYERDLRWNGLQLGLTLPIISVQATSRFEFDRTNSDAQFNSLRLTDRQKERQDLIVDKIRRQTHQTIGFTGNEWNKTGLGDLDAHVRWHKNIDHALLMRSIDVNMQLGVLAPTGILSETKTPVSLSVGTNGHWGVYSDMVTEFELKQDLTLGFMWGVTHLVPHTRSLRVSYGDEPTVFSTLVAPIQITPALTWKISPYLILGNLTDGLDFQVRYTYLRHNDDRWADRRTVPAVQSYLQRDNDMIDRKERLSRWRAHYVTMQLTYDTKEAQRKMRFEPTFTVGYDMPMAGNGIAKAHQLNIGIQLHF